MAPVTLTQAADEYLAGRKETSARTRSHGLRDFITWCDLNQLRLDDVRRVHIASYAQWLRTTRNLAANTVGSYLGSVANFYAYAHQQGIIPTDPAENIPRGNRRRYSETPWYSRDQAHALLHGSRLNAHPDVNAAIHLTLLNGLRVTETLTADVTHIHTLAGQRCLRLPHRKFVPGGHSVALPDATLAALAPLLDRRTSGRLIRIPPIRGHRSTPSTQPKASGARLRRHLRTLTNMYGLPDITPHGLRHTFITLARDAGVPDRDLMAAAGWSDPGMIAYYDRSHASVLRNAAHQVAALID